MRLPCIERSGEGGRKAFDFSIRLRAMLESERTADDDVGAKEGTDDGTGGPIAMHADQKSEPKRRGRKGTPVVCLDPQMTFPGVKEAAAWAGCNPGCISAVLAGRANTAGGYRWDRSETDADRDATSGQD